MLTTDDDGCLTSFQLRGRTVSGEDNTRHESQIVTILQCPSDTGFTVHVDANRLPIWELAGGHRICVRPSGTEPKFKLYLDVREPIADGEPLSEARDRAATTILSLRAALHSLLENE